MQSETRIDTHVKINTSIAGNVTKYINLHTQESFDKKILTLPNFAFKKIRYITEKFEKKKLEEKLTNRYDTQSVQSNAGKQSWSRTALKRCNNTEILYYYFF